MDLIYKIDFAILHFIRDNLSFDFLDFIMPLISFLGNKGWIWIAAAIIMLAVKRYRKNGAVLVIGLLACVIITNLILKNVIARDRPCWINETVQLLIAVPMDFSFPSGHSCASFAAAEIMRRCNKYWGIAAYSLAVLIAFSRLYLYVHFPSDVLAGAVLGFLIGMTVSLVCRNRLEFIDKIGRKADNTRLT